MKIPILRIFNYQKTIEFYIDWLGFKNEWEHEPDGAPIYMHISLDKIVLHLSEHHGDGTPGSAVLIEGSLNIREAHKI